MKTKLTIISLIFSIINISCKNDDTPTEELNKELTIKYIENFDGAGWEIDLKKARAFGPWCDDSQIEADLITDNTSVLFNNNSMRLIADHMDSCYVGYISESGGITDEVADGGDHIAKASASKKIQDIDIENLKVKQAKIEFNSDPLMDHYFYDFKIGNYIFHYERYLPESLNPFYGDGLSRESQKVTWKIVMDFEKNNHLFTITDKGVESTNLLDDIVINPFSNEKVWSLEEINGMYYSNPIITFKTKSVHDTTEQHLRFLPNSTVIDSLRISIVYFQN